MAPYIERHTRHLCALLDHLEHVNAAQRFLDQLAASAIGTAPERAFLLLSKTCPSQIVMLTFRGLVKHRQRVKLAASAMSLTSHLSRPLAPLSVWMRARFPMENRLWVLKECRQELCLATLPVPGRIKKGTKYPYALIGTALDYRLRLYFDVLPAKTVAFQGAFSATQFHQFARKEVRGAKDKSIRTAREDKMGRLPGAIGDFFEGLDQTIQEVTPAGRRLKTKDEQELARYCIVLGLWEQVFRAGPMINSPLWVPHPKTTADEMLDLATPQMVRDMCQLSRLFFERCSDLIAIGSKVVQNPTFKGSRMVGGADADFIADHCLWDIKTSIQNRISGDWLYQLLGYVLLDFDDAYQIREVGIYMARQGVRLQWPLQDLLNMLTDTFADEAPSLEERLSVLRQEFRTMLRAAAQQQKEDLEERRRLHSQEVDPAPKII